MSYYIGEDRRGVLPDADDADGSQCPHCDHVFWVAPAWSIDDGATGGVLCPECGEFIADDELAYDPPPDDGPGDPIPGDIGYP